MTAQKTNGRARVFRTASATGVAAGDTPSSAYLPEQPDASTVARADARPDARADARPREATALVRADEQRLLTQEALSLASAYRAIEQKRDRLRARMARCVALSPEEVSAVLLVHGVTGDMLGDA